MVTAPKRVFIDKQNPAAYKALTSLAFEIRAAAAAVGLPRSLMELVNVRVSQINRCVFCLDLHTRLALEGGESTQRLAVLPAWNETDLFDDSERAALTLAEAVTRVAGQHLDDAEYAVLNEQFDDAQLAVVIWAAVAINAFNRVSIMSRHPIKSAVAER
ncbi:carboxymuconolactone decarboxylase family protein [Antrihabitans spumae]|jgi:AhpD family alkylhydroperoxidase|uniref:Carboxymuconolactone decarboxylase family protein n=1 Tax=Antrihabitans spumae TaxID=3373370 RepID=A0ABW7KRY0_9NOCA